MIGQALMAAGAIAGIVIFAAAVAAIIEAIVLRMSGVGRD